LLERLSADRYVVYGVVTEVCVRMAAEGLLKTGKPVEIVTDAICSLDERNGSSALAALAARGALMTIVDRVAG